MYKLVLVKTPKEKMDFINFPKTIYSKYLRQDKNTEKMLLESTHILSRYFDFFPFILLDDKKVVARCAASIYHDSANESFLGFYECIEDINASKYMLEKVESFLKTKGVNKIIGPIDASFWIKYRFKINKFDKVPYSGEVYNKPYYYDFWLQSGYVLKDHYSSNRYNIPKREELDEKLRKRKEKMLSRGYIIRNATRSNFDSELRQIYKLLIVLFSDFPGFKYITEDEFFELFKNLKYILKYDMVKLGYKDEEMVAFFVCIPNYKNATILDLISTYIKPKEYILMYLGTSKQHPGMGTALSECIVEELSKKKCESIGALIKDNKISGNYYKDEIKDKYEYVLLEKNLD